MRAWKTIFHGLLGMWLLGCLLVPGIRADAGLEAGRMAVMDRKEVDVDRRVDVVLRVYAQKTDDPSAYRLLQTEAFNDQLKVPRDTPRSARLALVGRDQTDSTLKQALRNVIMYGACRIRVANVLFPGLVSPTPWICPCPYRECN